MVNRAITFSIIAILFLLILQSVWLYRLIDNERDEYRAKSFSLLEGAIKDELNSRVNRHNSLKNFRVVLSNNLTNNQISQEKIQDIKPSYDQKGIAEISIESVLQELYKEDAPLDTDTLSRFFSESLRQKGLGTSFSIEYISPDTIKRATVNYSDKKLILINPYFERVIPLTISEELILKAKIFYPSSVFKGDLLVILILSLIVTIFIFLSIIMQTRMLYKQVSLAKVKENITHFLTHELRSPLQSSITNLEVGQMTQGENSSFFLEKSREQLYLLNSLIENILDINKFEKKQTPLNKESFNVTEVIEPHIARHQTTKGKKVTINTNISPGSEKLFGDKLHITNAIGNLIDNAVKYSGENTEITVSSFCDNQYFHISVKDNGIGIPKEEQAKVFEKFYRIGKKEHSQKGKGFGLGLTYVMWVLKAHKGKVSLSSEPSKGSTFTLSFKKE